MKSVGEIILMILKHITIVVPIIEEIIKRHQNK